MTWQAIEFRNLEDYAQFMGAFQERTLPKQRWTHHAHLAGALWYLERWPPPEALQRIRRDIRAYNEAVGGINSDDAGYHETLTQLFMRAVLAQRRARPQAPLLDALRELLASPLASSAWPLNFYAKERLFSVAARRGWLEPDLCLEPRPWSTADDAAFTPAQETA
jgi:hypothetical protein